MADYLSISADETKRLAGKIVKSLGNNNLICLYGPLGSGKTTFVQGLAKSLGIKKPVISPTFIMVREYQTDNKKTLIHVDCYKINSSKDFKSVDLKEFWSNPDNLVVIEWADRIKEILPKERVDMKFDYINSEKDKRSIKVDFIN